VTDLFVLYLVKALDPRSNELVFPRSNEFIRSDVQLVDLKQTNKFVTT